MRIAKAVALTLLIILAAIYLSSVVAGWINEPLLEGSDPK